MIASLNGIANFVFEYLHCEPDGYTSYSPHFASFLTLIRTRSLSGEKNISGKRSVIIQAAIINCRLKMCIHSAPKLPASLPHDLMDLHLFSFECFGERSATTVKFILHDVTRLLSADSIHFVQICLGAL